MYCRLFCITFFFLYDTATTKFYTLSLHDALPISKIDPAEIQAGAVGNFNAGQFTKQLQLGAFIPEIDPKLRGIPTMHTEAACASGALSVLLGAEWIMGGLYDAVLVVGAEQQKTMSSLDGSDVLGAAADYHNERPEYGDFR